MIEKHLKKMMTTGKTGQRRFGLSRRKGGIGMSIFGYARVSSNEQNPDRQIQALQKYVNSENIVVDKQSGKNLERDGYSALKGRFGLRAGDQLYITSLDRLSRNKEDIKKELAWFKENHVRLMILDLPSTLVTVAPDQQWILDMVQNILIEVLASMAEQERILIRKRQREGIEAARQKGKHLGRPFLKIPDNFEAVYKEWKAGNITAVSAQKQLNMSSTSFYRQVRKRQLAEPKDL